MYTASNFLTTLERRHGPLHGLVSNWANQWRWKRQLAAMTNAPAAHHFPTLQVIHARIHETSLDYTSPDTLRVLQATWQQASDALARVVDEADGRWLATNRFSV